MNPYLFPIALVAFLGFVLLLPGWMYHLEEVAPVTLTTESYFLAQLVLPATVLLFLASWIQPLGGDNS